MKPTNYLVAIEPLSEEDDGGFVASVPDLPGCMSDGDTPQDALANVGDAIVAWIEGAKDMGRSIPAPSAHGDGVVRHIHVILRLQ